ncbi:MAG: peptide ABC transporter substrate-binding protein [Candidatus Paceibacterota bacterium]
MEHEPRPGKRPLFDLVFSYLDALRPSDRLILFVLAVIFLASTAYALINLSLAYTTDVPSSGGTLVEGIVGTPRFVNPVLALTRTDNDLTVLIYSGLMKLDADGALTPDLAESVTVSEDGLVYNVVLRSDIQFHDGSPIRADDVAFTIELIQNPDLKSPLRGNWNGVRVEVLGDRELNFVLADAYTPFLENLTVGIMPQHIWESLTIEELAFSQHNTEPIGSGPYKHTDTSRSKTGLINGYTLTAHEDGRGRANIPTVIVQFFQNEEELEAAYVQGELTSTASLPNDTVARFTTQQENSTVIEAPLPRVFSVFFNQNRSIALRDASARKALSAAVDRAALVSDVLDGYGIPTTSPIPSGFLPEEQATGTLAVGSDTSLDEARAILSAGGWTQNESGQWGKEIDDSEVILRVTLATANASVFEETAFYLEHVWSELGVEVSVELYEQSDLVQAVIRPRNYEALLFGTEIGRSLDLYPFWHSSQREDPGLNVALYANITTDALLRTARTTQDEAERLSSLRDFEAEVHTEAPAIFLYSPTFTYLIRTDVHPTDMVRISRPSERFSNIRDWYMNEESVWQMFVQD